MPRVHAVLEWSGIPNRPHLRPLGDDEEVVRVNDDKIDGPVELADDDEFSVGKTRLAVIY